ncbi:hypothetical protein SCOR_25315 [Sulfidibacter corallicola]
MPAVAVPRPRAGRAKVGDGGDRVRAHPGPESLQRPERPGWMGRVSGVGSRQCSWFRVIRPNRAPDRRDRTAREIRPVQRTSLRKPLFVQGRELGGCPVSREPVEAGSCEGDRGSVVGSPASRPTPRPGSERPGGSRFAGRSHQCDCLRAESKLCWLGNNEIEGFMPFFYKESWPGIFEKRADSHPNARARPGRRHCPARPRGPYSESGSPTQKGEHPGSPVCCLACGIVFSRMRRRSRPQTPNQPV